MSKPKSILWDVIVIGAGPAGSSAAYDIAAAGKSVLLLEKRQMPRNKLCGGALSEVALSYLRFPIPKELENWQCYGARVHFGKWVTSSKLEDRIAVLVTRRRLDHFLAQKAEEKGAELLFEPALSLKTDANRVKVITAKRTYHGKLVIVAAGSSSRYISHVRRPDNEDEKALCLEQSYPRLDPDPYSDLEGLIDIYFGVGEFGYGWVFHHGEYYSIGIGGLLSRMKNPKDLMKQFWIQRGFPEQDFNPSGHMLPCGGIKRVLFGNRVMLTGDSAGFVDPFYGEGIAYAIRSGQIAAEVALSAIKKSDFSNNMLQQYAQKCKREFDVNLWYSLQLTRIMHWKPNTFLHLLSSDQKILKKYLLVPKGDISYFRYLSWLIPQVPWLYSKSLLKSKIAKR
jgi:geranylgeranyl reductase family protein